MTGAVAVPVRVVAVVLVAVGGVILARARCGINCESIVAEEESSTIRGHPYMTSTVDGGGVATCRWNKGDFLNFIV